MTHFAVRILLSPIGLALAFLAVAVPLILATLSAKPEPGSLDAPAYSRTSGTR